MNIDDIKTIAVIGAGDMGHGIAEVALIAGYKVYLRDINTEFVERGVARIHASLEKLVSKGKVPAEHYEKIKSELLISCTDLGEAVASADLVISAVPGFMGFTTLKSVIEAGKNVVDISFFPEDPMALDDLAKSKQVTSSAALMV